MFKQTAKKSPVIFSPKRVEYFLKDYQLDPDNVMPEHIVTACGDVAFMIRDITTKESILFTAEGIICNCIYHYPSEEHENCFKSRYLDNLYGDIVLGVPENPHWDIYQEYDWYKSDEGFWTPIEKPRKEVSMNWTT